MGTSIGASIDCEGPGCHAAQEGADAVAHGATGKGMIRSVSAVYAALALQLKVVAPWMEVFREAFPGRKEMIDYCKEQGINVEASA